MKPLTRKYKDYKEHSETDLIIRYLQDETGDVKLPESLEKKLVQLDKADNLIRMFGSRQKVVPMLVSTLGINKRLADSLFNQAQEVYGSVAKYKKKYWIQVNMDWISDARDRAIAAKDFKVLALVIRESVKLLSLMDDEEGSAPKNVMYYLEYRPNSLGLESLSDEDIERLKKKFMAPKKRNNTGIEISDAEIIDDHDS